jgi:hypothetical protein
MATGSGPWNLSASTSLEIIVDGGKDIISPDEEVASGEISVDLSSLGASATAAQVEAALNADADFAARCLAYIDEATGLLSIRSKNLGDFYSIELGPSVDANDVNEVVFGEDTNVHIIGGYYPGNYLLQHVDPSEDDPKTAWTAGSITYTLDTVDFVEPGTYVASVEIADLGRASGTDYKTPSVAWVTFNVGQEDEEPLVANNCNACHQDENGVGFVLDYARHYKIFADDAVDQCGACHDYQNGHDYGDWYGGKPINKRVHAVHYGSSLNYPNTTVMYNDPHHGRNWDITFPQDVRHCEACHTDATSGSWMTNAARLPCSGCHDSMDVQAHMLLQTWDPTPDDPWSGDEMESCQTCH